MMRHYIKIMAIAFGLLGQGCSRNDKQFEAVLKNPDQFQGQDTARQQTDVKQTKNAKSKKCNW